MAEYLQKARGLASAADRKLLSFGFFSNKHEEAAELYESAANQFKLAKAWQEAGDVLVKLADLSGGKLESKHDAAAALVEAAKAYGKLPEGAGSARALKCLRSAVSLYTEMGRLGMAARQLREAAEVAERAGERGDARLFYEQAADLFATDSAPAEANRCLLKVAQFAAEGDDFPRAIEIYEAVARASVDVSLVGVCVGCFGGGLGFRTRRSLWAL
jgi:alpha-soluble NSF attachment protein